MGKALLFPGQAAQFVGMGQKITSHSEHAARLLGMADDLLGYDLSAIMSEGPEEKLKETIYTQPAVYVQSYLVFKANAEKAEYSALAGHSLGEITACVAGGALSFEDGLRLVQVRAEAMQAACEANPSTMAAILGMEDDLVEEICTGIDAIVVPANYNCPGQLVISGSKKGIDLAIEQCKEKGARRALEIAVGGAFHSPLMEPAVAKFKETITAMSFKDSEYPIYQNVDATPYTDAATIKANLIRQITSPVRWTQSIQAMIIDGIDYYVEVGGKGKILLGMLRKISREVESELWGEGE